MLPGIRVTLSLLNKKTKFKNRAEARFLNFALTPGILGASRHHRIGRGQFFNILSFSSFSTFAPFRAFGSSGSVLEASGGSREASGSVRRHMERSHFFRHFWKIFIFDVFGHSVNRF